jgi:hypothetical protein
MKDAQNAYDGGDESDALCENLCGFNLLPDNEGF